MTDASGREHSDYARQYQQHHIKDGVVVASQWIGQSTTLTKREQFAMAAMQGMLAKGGSYDRWSDLASDAVDQADALIAELNRDTATTEPQTTEATQ